MKTLDVIAAGILVVGGLNWGLVAATRIDLVSVALGDLTAIARVTYGLVGVAAIYQALAWKAIQKRWALAWARY